MNALGLTALAVVFGSVGASLLLAAWRFPTGFGSGFRRYASGVVGTSSLLASLPLLAVADSASGRHELSPGEGFERALRWLPVALADLEQPKSYSFDVGLRPTEIVSSLTVNGTHLRTISTWKGIVDDPSKPLVMVEVGGGVSDREPRVTATFEKADGDGGSTTVNLSGPRRTPTKGGNLRTWLATVEASPTLRAGDQVTIKVVEEVYTEETASAFWFDPRDYPSSLVTLTMCAEPVIGAFPFLWSDERILQIDVGHFGGSTEAYEEPAGIRRDGGRICVRETGTMAPLEPFVVLFLQDADQLTAMAVGGAR